MARWEEWLRRYAPAELLALIGALAGYLLVLVATHHAAAAAYGAAVGDNLAYYGLLAARESRRGLAAVGALAIEFGPAEALDSTVVRPACTALGAAALGPVAGVIAAKIVADLLFYVPVITSYELRKRAAGERSGATFAERSAG
jgi:hypothetical protein